MTVFLITVFMQSHFGPTAVCTSVLTDETRKRFDVGGSLAGGGGGGGGASFVAKVS